MSCEELLELTTDYLDDALPQKKRSLFESHLTQCTICVEYLKQMKIAIEITGSLRNEPVDEAAREGLKSAFREWRRRRG